MRCKGLKERYEAPLAGVRGVLLEGAIADSCDPAIGHGGVKYTPYATPVEDERDIELY
jgi:hypothetical protein